VSGLTEAAFAAVVAVHEFGQLGPGATRAAAMRRRMADAGYLARADDGTYRPELAPWADGFGRWHVRVSVHLPPGVRSDLASAAITGEARARAGHWLTDWTALVRAAGTRREVRWRPPLGHLVVDASTVHRIGDEDPTTGDFLLRLDMAPVSSWVYDDGVYWVQAVDVEGGYVEYVEEDEP